LLSFVIFGLMQPIALEIKAEPAKTKAVIKVAAGLGVGGLGDLSFSDMCYVGLQRAEAEGYCTFEYQEPDSVDEYETMFRTWAEDGSYDLIVALGFESSTAVDKISDEFPNQKFVLVDMVVFKNEIRNVVYAEEEGSFMVGAMAGLMTKKDKVGFVGGKDNDLIRKFWAGYKSGVLYENEECKVIEDFVGDWNDPVTAKGMAETMWADGCDIIYAAAGASGAGVLDAVEPKVKGDFWVIGVDADQDYVYPGQVLTSMVKRVDLGVYNAIKDVSTDNWSTGIIEMDLASFGVGISALEYTETDIGAANIEKVNVTIRDKIVSGEISVPTNKTELESWMEDMGIGTEDEGIPGFELLITLSGLAVVPIIFRRRRR
jgi:basic membrane protein A